MRSNLNFYIWVDGMTGAALAQALHVHGHMMHEHSLETAPYAAFVHS